MNTIPGLFNFFYSTLSKMLPTVPRRSVLTLVLPLVFVVASLHILTFTSVSRFIDQKIFHPLVFTLREKVRPQKLDPRIKIFSFDNRTASFLKSLDVPLETWGLVIEAIGQKSEVKILANKLFDSAYSTDEIQKFSEIMAKTKARTGLISFTYPGEISYRLTLSGEQITSNENKSLVLKENTEHFEKQSLKSTPYGAQADLLKLFSIFGHNDYKGDNRLSPIIFLEGKGILPHAALAITGSLGVSGSSILMNAESVPVGRDGKLLLNFFPKETYQKASYSLVAVIERAKKSQDISIVNPGDFVLLLPAMYTGSTEFQETPFGPLPGGYVMAALLNSSLSGKWLTEVSDYGLLLLILSVAGFFIGTAAKPGYAILILLVTGVVVVLGSISLFIFGGVAYSFVIPLIALLISGLTGIVMHGNIASIEEVRIHRELEVATLVQKSFFPKTSDESTNMTSVEGRFIPASECGGDWWGCYRRNGYTYVMLGDAIGHGVPAALVTAVAFSVSRTIDMELETFKGAPVAPSRFLKGINDVLCEMNSALACMTFLIFRIHDETGKAVYVNAGNLQPVLIPRTETDARLPKGQRMKTLLARGDVLGLGKDPEIQEHEIDLVSGDKIVLYTDGLIENKSPKTRQQLGKKWLKDQLAAASQEPSRKFCDYLWKQYSTEIGQAKVDDDVTIVLVERV